MIEHQPSLFGKERHRPGADLGALPCAVGERSHFHQATVLAPVFHVGTEGNEYVAERRMAVVARARHHGKASVETLWEEHAVAVERQECVLALIECLEVESIAYADGRAVISVAPCDPVTVLNPCDTRVIFVFAVDHFGVARLEFYRLVGNVPVHAVLGESHINVHLHGLVVATEHSGIAVAERHDGTVENTVGDFGLITTDNRIL